MTEQGRADVVERFEASNGRLPGYLGLAIAAGIVIVAILDWDPGRPLGIIIIAVLGGLLVWAALLRPGLWVTHDDLVMRGMFHTDQIPLAAIDKVTTSQVLAVYVGDRRFVTAVIGQTARQTLKTRAGRGASTSNLSEVHSHTSIVEARIVQLAQETRLRDRIRSGSPEQQALAAGVRRNYAWPEIVGVAVCVLAYVAWWLT